MAEPSRIAHARAAWDLDDQFATQYAAPAGRELIETRWSRFGDALSQWRSERQGPLAVLDAGCGDGINLVGLTALAARHGWDMALHGFDRNSLRLERARRTGANLSLAMLPNLPYADGQFDAILCNHVIEHIPDYATALRELRRILRPHGLLLVGVPNEGCALARLRNNMLQRSILATTDHVNFFTAAKLARALDQAGFRTQRIMGEGFFWPHMAMTRIIQRSAAGRRLTTVLGHILPSQAAGLLAVAVG